MMKPLQLAIRYLEILFNKGNLDDLKVLFTVDFKFTGPFYEFHSSDEYIRSLKSDPPKYFSYKILKSFQDDHCACIIYQFSKPGINTPMAQIFELENEKIKKYSLFLIQLYSILLPFKSILFFQAARIVITFSVQIQAKMHQDLQIKARIYVQVKGNNLLGPGRIELMEKIHSTGSIAKAAREMSITYRKAQRLVNHINEQFSKDAIVTWKGGPEHGGAKLSDWGLKLVARYKALKLKVNALLSEEESKFFI